MKKLKIENFGPIAKGYANSPDGFFDIGKISVFVGAQGAGKSSIAKIISLFSWFEKQFLSDKSFTVDKKQFKGTFLKYHRIDAFLRDDTYICYKTDETEIRYENGNLSFTLSDKSNEKYIRPKVLYIPAERSFCTAITNPNKVSGIPSNVRDFLSDYYDAVKAQNGQKLPLPLNGYEFRFLESENSAYISDKNSGYEIRIEDASSGLQSLTPLYVTIQYFVSQISRPLDERYSEFTLEQINNLKSVMTALAVEKKLEKERIDKILADTKNAYDTIKKSNRQKKYINSRLICIIEEPEQSLFPSSQYDVIMSLLRDFSNSTENSLVLTTHSPYILETINNSIYADAIQKSGHDASPLIPVESHISYENVSAYLVEDGSIFPIKDDEIKQINPEAIDKCSQKISDMYSKLSDIEFGAKQ